MRLTITRVMAFLVVMATFIWTFALFKDPSPERAFMVAWGGILVIGYKKYFANLERRSNASD